MTTTAPSPRSVALIRNEPVQARSTARLAALLDAAARVIDRIGYERLTTAMVAEGAGASIGTVYRYFPDRIAVLQSLASRNLERVGEAALSLASASSDARGAVDAVFDRLVEAFRSEPGFASLRFGDTIDLRPIAGDGGDAVFAERLHGVLKDRFSARDDAKARVAVQAAYTVADALIGRAFVADPRGDAALLETGRRTIHGLLDPIVG